MKIAIDVGYGYTKGISETGEKCIFPSMIAPAIAESTGAMFSSLPYLVQVNSEKWYVGERAGQCTTCLTLPGQTKKNGKVHNVLLLTASRLLGVGDSEEAELVVGLPLAYFRHQKEELREQLQNLSDWVAVGSENPKHIRFSRVEVFPQGAGCLILASDLPDNGLILLIDVGTYTTEFLTFEFRNGQPYPIPDACSSIEYGVHTTHLGLSHAWTEKTGTPLAPRIQEQILQKARNEETISFEGRKINLYPDFCRIAKQTSDIISTAVKSTLQDRISLLDRTILAGGGAELLYPYINTEFPAPQLLPFPVMANAEGYLKLLLEE